MVYCSGIPNVGTYCRMEPIDLLLMSLLINLLTNMCKQQAQKNLDKTKETYRRQRYAKVETKQRQGSECYDKDKMIMKGEKENDNKEKRPR